MTAGQFSLDLHGHVFAHEELSAELITDAINTLDGKDTYAVLAPNANIASSAYLQTAPTVADGQYSDESPMLVEIRLEHPDGSFTHLRRESCGRDEVRRYFVDYWAESKLPDLAGFEDVTKEFL
ncbi:MAG: hypothetical protein FWH11_14990 [Micrococcales bacterium]|nr:hypothetical protein [Micrococcales bacterium]